MCGAMLSPFPCRPWLSKLSRVTLLSARAAELAATVSSTAGCTAQPAAPANCTASAILLHPNEREPRIIEGSEYMTNLLLQACLQMPERSNWGPNAARRMRTRRAADRICLLETSGPSRNDERLLATSLSPSAGRASCVHDVSFETSVLGDG